MTLTAAYGTPPSLPKRAALRPRLPGIGRALLRPLSVSRTRTQNGQVSQALRALGTRQILARSLQARGRSERAFGTLQERLPQELRLNRITNYADAHRYLEEHFMADFNRRFTVQLAQHESAFIKLLGIELELVLSAKRQLIVCHDNTVAFQNVICSGRPPASACISCAAR